MGAVELQRAACSRLCPAVVTRKQQRMGEVRMKHGGRGGLGNGSFEHRCRLTVPAGAYEHRAKVIQSWYVMRIDRGGLLEKSDGGLQVTGLLSLNGLIECLDGSLDRAMLQLLNRDAPGR